MALVTEDVYLNYNDEWTALVVTGSVIHVTESNPSKNSKNKIFYRQGIGSTSAGLELEEGMTVSSNETVYVRPSSNDGKVLKVTVTKD